MKRFLCLFIIGLAFFISMNASARAQSANQTKSNSSTVIDKSSTKKGSFVESARGELKQKLASLSSEEQNKFIKDLKAVQSKAALQKLLPEFYKKNVPNWSVPFNTTYCYNKCRKCGAQMSDEGAALTTAGACIAACLDSNRQKARNLGRACLDSIVKYHLPDPKPEPKKEEPKKLVEAEKKPEEPQPVEPAKQPELPPSTIVVKTVNEDLVCERPEPLIVDYPLLEDYLAGRLVRDSDKVVHVVVGNPQPPAPLRRRETAAPQPIQAPTGKGTQPQQPSVGQQSPQQQEDDDDKGSSGILEGVIGAVGAIASGEGVGGAAKAFSSEKRRAEEEAQLENERRRAEREARGQYFGGAYPPQYGFSGPPSAGGYFPPQQAPRPGGYFPPQSQPAYPAYPGSSPQFSQRSPAPFGPPPYGFGSRPPPPNFYRPPPGAGITPGLPASRYTPPRYAPPVRQPGFIPREGRDGSFISEESRYGPPPPPQGRVDPYSPTPQRIWN